MKSLHQYVSTFQDKYIIMDELERIYSKLDKDGTKTLNSDQIIEGKNDL